MIKVLSVFGTRPEGIKMAPVVKALEARPDVFSSRVCVTAQHREMLDQVLRVFSIRPDYDLDIMVHQQTPAHVASAVLARLEPVLLHEQPDWVLVQGDTTTAAAAALAAFYCRCRIGHVEAGLRTGDRWRPFPEEINRRVAAVLADAHFAPTETARRNLLHEGVPANRILVTGNPVIDALYWAAARPFDLATLGVPPLIDDCDGPARRVLLVTAHRRENLGRPLEEICLALRDIAEQYHGSVHIVFPVHPNPEVWGPVHRLLEGAAGISLIPAVDYLPLVHLMRRAYLILTDSGGMQEEGPALGKPVLVLRDVTERPEAISSGSVRLVGTDRNRIVAETTRLLEDTEAYAAMARVMTPYGDGHAAARIADWLQSHSAAEAAS